MIDIDLLKRAVNESRDGITISDATQPDNPLIFVNPAFEKMTGYSQDDVIGRNCRFLQGQLRDQPGLANLREALQRGEPCIVTLQNFRKNATLFWNELSISPIHDANGRLTHFLGIQKDVSSEKLMEFVIREEKEQLQQVRERLEHESTTDALTGLYNRRYLDEHTPDLLQRVVIEKRAMTVMLLDLDHFKELNDRAGHAAGDAALSRVGECLKQSRRRSGDILARYGGEEFAVVCYDLDPEGASAFADRLLKRVRDLQIPHPDNASGYVTLSAGWISVTPSQPGDADALFEAADAALYKAKEAGRDRAMQAQALNAA